MLQPSQSLALGVGMRVFFLAGRGFLASLAAFQVSVVARAPIHPVVCPTAGARSR